MNTIVSVLGTLLNRLFRTQFDVMSGGMRQQTTRGIWMGKAQDAPILVMDVEGTDGQERGEDQANSFIEVEVLSCRCI